MRRVAYTSASVPRRSVHASETSPDGDAAIASPSRRPAAAHAIAPFAGHPAAIVPPPVRRCTCTVSALGPGATHATNAPPAPSLAITAAHVSRVIADRRTPLSGQAGAIAPPAVTRVA
ncbi:MAG: hypothetical protein IPJ04_01755 [Candidatus Eisenbacteria bacterium]|nr:hypothetical protein [Candidatus Eisenbacteria bacterium]